MKTPMINKMLPELNIDSCGYIDPNDLEASLQKWYDSQKDAFGNDSDDGVYWGRPQGSSDTHRAKLCFIEPLKKESAEDILRELVRHLEQPALYSLGKPFEKAREYLDGKK